MEEAILFSRAAATGADKSDLPTSYADESRPRQAISASAPAREKIECADTPGTHHHRMRDAHCMRTTAPLGRGPEAALERGIRHIGQLLLCRAPHARDVAQLRERQQFLHFLQRRAQGLGATDKAQSCDFELAIAEISRGQTSLGREQSAAFVVAHVINADARALGEGADANGFHTNSRSHWSHPNSGPQSRVKRQVLFDPPESSRWGTSSRTASSQGGYPETESTPLGSAMRSRAFRRGADAALNHVRWSTQAIEVLGFSSRGVFPSAAVSRHA